MSCLWAHNRVTVLVQKHGATLITHVSISSQNLSSVRTNQEGEPGHPLSWRTKWKGKSKMKAETRGGILATTKKGPYDPMTMI